ncbi:MAG TPA: hypothetical protein VM076_09070 [Gemmatimonadaceae bacterium]|nr:hypothetical protein [Gemmatimonadaceae bacterium]
MQSSYARSTRPPGISVMLWGGFLTLFLASGVATAQQRDTTRRSPRDSVRADSARAADSIAVVRELERLQGEPKTPTQGQPQQGQGPTNARLLPDISAVGDLVGDLSPKGSTQENGARFAVREVEIAVQAAVDPYFRGDVFLGFSDLEKVSIEQAYLTATALPWGLEVRLGRLLMPVGKQNTTHRHDLHTIDHSYAVQRFFGEEGLKGTGIYASRIFAPFGFYQELILTAVDRFGGADEGVPSSIEPVNKKLGGLGYSGRLRNYWDLNEATNLELSFSGVTGKREQPLESSGVGLSFSTPARQTVLGTDFTYRWRPLQQGLYKSFILQGEFLQQLNEKDPRLLLPSGVPSAGITYQGPARNFSGGYVFARYQLTRRGFLGARFDSFQDEAAAGRTSTAGSGYLEWFPSEFSKLLAGYERYSPAEGSATNRILLQATFALGPHKPHPF